MKRRGVKHFGLKLYNFTHGRNENSRNITEHNKEVCSVVESTNRCLLKPIELPEAFRF